MCHLKNNHKCFLDFFHLGQGFKMAPATGKILAALALDEYASHDISGYSLTRFSNVLKVKAAL